jgi:DNA repair exonuclease SbcCD ATPase subunit
MRPTLLQKVQASVANGDESSLSELIRVRKQLDDQAGNTQKKAEQAKAFLTSKKELETQLAQALQANAKITDDCNAWQEDFNNLEEKVKDLESRVGDRGRATTRKQGPRMSTELREYARMTGIPIDSDDEESQVKHPQQPQVQQPQAQQTNHTHRLRKTPGPEKTPSAESLSPPGSLWEPSFRTSATPSCQTRLC